MAARKHPQQAGATIKSAIAKSQKTLERLALEGCCHAIAKKDPALFTGILNFVSDVNAPLDTAKSRLLHYASSYGEDATMTKILLDRGADPDVQDRRGATPLHVATAPETTALLLQRGADPNLADERGCTPLHYADWDHALALLNQGADWTVKDRAGRGFIDRCIAAAEEGDDSGMQVLVRSTIDPSAFLSLVAPWLTGHQAAALEQRRSSASTPPL